MHNAHETPSWLCLPLQIEINNNEIKMHYCVDLFLTLTVFVQISYTSSGKTFIKESKIQAYIYESSRVSCQFLSVPTFHMGQCEKYRFKFRILCNKIKYSDYRRIVKLLNALQIGFYTNEGFYTHPGKVSNYLPNLIRLGTRKFE